MNTDGSSIKPSRLSSLQNYISFAKHTLVLPMPASSQTQDASIHTVHKQWKHTVLPLKPIRLALSIAVRTLFIAPAAALLALSVMERACSTCLSQHQTVSTKPVLQEPKRNVIAFCNIGHQDTKSKNNVRLKLGTAFTIACLRDYRSKLAS